MNSLIFLLMAAIIKGNLGVSSPDFGNKQSIPTKFSCVGENINPALIIHKIPVGAKTLAIIMSDPDTDKGTFDHWVVWNIPPIELIKENTAPGKVGKNGKGENMYHGPCPPNGTHRYIFMVYALDITLELDDNTDKTKLLTAMQGHILATGELTGLFKKP